MANIVIVGANQGIGYHMAKRLLELNHSVVVLDIDISNIRQLQPRYPETLLPIVVDARRLSDIENGVKQAAGRFESIDIAIHNACRCTFMSEPDSDYDVYRDREQQLALAIEGPDVFFLGVYLNKKLLHDIVKYTRYSVLFKYTTTTYSSAFNIVSYLQATFSRFKRQISDKF